MLQTGNGDLSYTMRISRKKCTPGILFIIFVIVHYNWTFSFKENSSEISSTDAVMRHYFAAESTRRLFTIDELDVVIKSMSSTSNNEQNNDKTLSLVIPCRQDQSVERQYYRQMIEHFSDVVDFAINVIFVTFVTGVEHLQRSSELDLVIVLNGWKADYTDIYCKCLHRRQYVVFSTLKISTYLIV